MRRPPNATSTSSGFTTAHCPRSRSRGRRCVGASCRSRDWPRSQQPRASPACSLRSAVTGSFTSGSRCCPSSANSARRRGTSCWCTSGWRSWLEYCSRMFGGSPQSRPGEERDRYFCGRRCCCPRQRQPSPGCTLSCGPCFRVSRRTQAECSSVDSFSAS